MSAVVQSSKLKLPTFKRETYLGKVSQYGSPMGFNGLMYNYDKHTSKRAPKMNIEDHVRKMPKPKPFEELTKHKFTPDQVEVNKWDAMNPDRRGFKSAKEFRGDRPLKFKPSLLFNPDIKGSAATIRSGYHQGGNTQHSTSATAHIAKRYAQNELGVHMGDQNQRVDRRDLAISKKPVDPFAPKIKATLKVKILKPDKFSV